VPEAVSMPFHILHAQHIRSAVLGAIPRLVRRGAAGAQVAHLARDVAEPELQRRQLVEAAAAVLSIAFAAALEQVVEVRRAAGACVCLRQRAARLLRLRLLLSGGGVEE
jgi:hypothetical protein